MPRRPTVDYALLALGAIVLVSTIARFLLSRGVAAPWIAPDEQLYGLLGRSLVAGDGLRILGGAVPYYSLLYPLFVGLPFIWSDVAGGVAWVQAPPLPVTLSPALVPVLAGHSSTTLVGIVSVGGVVSRTVMVWTALVLLPHWSVTVQVRQIVSVPPQLLLTTSL